MGYNNSKTHDNEMWSENYLLLIVGPPMGT